MAESRLIHKDLLLHPGFCTLKLFTRDLYLRLWLHADDTGRYHAATSLLRPFLYPTELDKTRESDIERALLDLESASLVRLYNAAGARYLEIPADIYRQRIRAKSLFPAPPHTAADAPQPAADLSQSAATCGDSPQSAAIRRNPPQPAALIEIEENRIKTEEKEGEYITPRSISEPPHTPPTSIFRDLQERETYRHWLHAVKPAHPSGREMQTLPKNLHTIAITAFRTVPQAADHADLLRAFYDSTITISTKTGRPFKKPDIFQYYLTDLADVLTAAKQWAKELKWKPRTTTPKPEIQNPKSNIQNPDYATPAETDAFLADMREALATIGQPPPSDYIITD